MINKTHIAAVTATAIFAISGIATGEAQAASNARIDASAPIEGSSKPAVGLNFGPELPLSPMSQQNAVRAAEDYLDYTAFSRQGLIDQLEYEDYSTEDATFAVDHITVDWNEQAVKAAQDYLDYTSFSRGGLIEQLVYSGFTPAQAQYGAAAVGY
jgi:hypothetical protein